MLRLTPTEGLKLSERSAERSMEPGGKTMRTGKTQQMLEAAVASDAETVVVLAHTRSYASDLQRRAIDMVPGAQARNGEIRRPDGRRVLFAASAPGARLQDRLRGYRMVAVYADHHAWEMWGHALQERLTKAVSSLPGPYAGRAAESVVLPLDTLGDPESAPWLARVPGLPSIVFTVPLVMDAKLDWFAAQFRKRIDAVKQTV